MEWLHAQPKAGNDKESVRNVVVAKVQPLRIQVAEENGITMTGLMH